MTDITDNRLYTALLTQLGKEVADLLTTEHVTDLMLDVDGSLWCDSAERGRHDTGIVLRPEPVTAALKLVANHCGRLLHAERPILNATMPRTGERVAATIPPITEAPTFAIRIPPTRVFPLDAFCAAGDDGAVQAKVVELLLTERRNVLISGATGGGKTSLLSSLLQFPSVRDDRILVLESEREIICDAPDHVRLLTSEHVDMRDLVRHCLRYRPDRIIVGEVRDGAAAVEMVRAMNTGHSGSFCTLHANSAEDALQRLEDLCREQLADVSRRSIAGAIGAIIHMERRDDGRKIREIVRVDGVMDRGYYEIERVWP